MLNFSGASPNDKTRSTLWVSCVFAVGVSLSSNALPQALPAPVTRPETAPEVVVTARKIEEDLREIPMSVQALSGDFLDQAGSTRLYELQFAVPGLVVNSTGMAGAGFSLRGIADQRVTGLSVAPHLNGIYLGNANLAIARMFDLERIEVLKGPQGTLYGRNATGGSINFITRPPQDAFSAEIEGAYGSFETTRVQGHLNLPFQSSAFRLAFITSDGDGYIRNSVDDRRFAEDDYWGVRGSLRIDTSDDLRVDIVAQHIRDDGASGELWSPRPDFLLDPADIRLTTVTLANPYLISEIDNLNVKLEYDLGFATLRSLTGYARSEVRNLDDCAGMPILQGCVRGTNPTKYDQWSQELQLVFPRTGSVEGLVGAYYSDSDSSRDFHQLLPLLNSQPLNDYQSTSSEPAAAVFGQATVRLAEGWSATGGVRLSWERHRVSTIGTGVQDSPTPLRGENDSDDVSWRVDLKHEVTDDLMIYASVSTGYKSGGFITTSFRNGEPDSFGPENLTAYEIGGKSQWLDRRLTLNAAAFFYDYQDLQVSRTAVEGGQLIVEVDNAAKAELYGLDAEASFHVSQRLSVSGGVVWLPKREFVEYINEVTGDTLSGDKLVRAPKWTAAGAISYELPVSQSGKLSGRLEYSYRSGYFYTQENDPRFAQGSFGLLNLYLRFEAASESWYVFASGHNLTDEDYFNHVFLQSSPGYPDTYEIGVGYRF